MGNMSKPFITRTSADVPCVWHDRWKHKEFLKELRIFGAMYKSRNFILDLANSVHDAAQSIDYESSDSIEQLLACLDLFHEANEFRQIAIDMFDEAVWGKYF